MRKKRFSLRVLAAAVVVGLLCGLTPMGAWAAAPAEEEENEMHTLRTDRTVEEDVRYERRQYQTAEPVDRIEVDEVNAAIIVQAAKDANTETVTVDYADAAEPAASLYTFTVEGGTLTIRKEREPEPPVLGLWWLGGYNYVSGQGFTDRSLVITLPQKQYESISAVAANGTITFKNVCAREMAGALAVGDIRLENTVSDIVELGAAKGDIEFRRARASVYDCAAAVGSIKGTLVGDKADYAISTVTLSTLLWPFGDEDKTGPESEKRIEFVSMVGSVRFQFVQ